MGTVDTDNSDFFYVRIISIISIKIRISVSANLCLKSTKDKAMSLIRLPVKRQFLRMRLSTGL